MSGDNDESREALTLNQIKHMRKEKLEELAESGIDVIKEASDEVRREFDRKCEKMGVDNPFIETGSTNDPFRPGSMNDTPEPKAPAFVKQLSKSEPDPAPESRDIEYMSYQEIMVSDEINTLRYRLVEAPELGDTANDYIERCVGLNPETKRLRVVRIPAKRIEVIPGQVMRYLGNVVQDLNSVHTGNIVLSRRRFGYVFDRFFYYNGKKLPRCCLVEDRIHQAGLMYEKFVHRKGRRAMARIRRIPKSDSPMYEVVGAKETDYRDLKRLFERHFLQKNDRLEEADPAFIKLIEGQIPLVPTE